MPNIHNNVIDISSFQTSKLDLTFFLAQLVSILRAKCSHKVVIRGNICLIFGYFFPKCTFLRLSNKIHFQPADVSTPQ